MHFIATGLHGFIGRHLSERLSKAGHTVVPIDRKLFEGGLDEFVQKEQPDYILHLGTYGNMSDQVDREKTFKANVENTFKLLLASQNVKYKAFVNFSSSSVLLENQTMYSATKKMAEILVEQFPRTVSIRPSTVIGVGEQSSHLIPTLIRSCLFGEAMPFVSEPTHDFISVNDLISGVIKIVDNMGIVDKQVNVSSGKIYSNELIRQRVERLTGKKANVKEVKYLRTYDTLNWKVDNSALVALGWKVQETIEQTISNMIKNQILN